MDQVHCSETSVNNYQFALRNTPEERRSHIYRGLKTESTLVAIFVQFFCVSEVSWINCRLQVSRQIKLWD